MRKPTPRSREASHPPEIIFKEHFPDASIEKISVDQIPAFVIELFEIKSQVLIPVDRYRPMNFDRFFLITHNNGSRTYCADQVKYYSDESDTEQLSYFIDVNDDEEFQGDSELRKRISVAGKSGSENAFFVNKPFVGGTHTQEYCRRKGLGLRRIRMMNAYAQMTYGLPLHSDTLLSPEAKRLWERLVKEGEAKRYKEGKHDRFQFV